MADCDEKKFYSPGQEIGREPTPASCTPSEPRIPEELRRPDPGVPIPETEPDPPPLLLGNRAQEAKCVPDEYGNPRYGDPTIIVAGVYTGSYRLQGVTGVSEATLRYIEDNDLVPWITSYVNEEGWYSPELAGPTGPTKSAAVLAAKTGLTKAQADQLLKETEVILLQLDALAMQAAKDMLACVWKNVLIQLPCPVDTVEYENGVPGAVVAAGMVSSSVSQADADTRARTIGENSIVCHYLSLEYIATCEEDRNMPDVPTDLHPVYPGLEPRVSSYTAARGLFTSLTSSEDASEKAKRYAISQLVCYYVNDPVEKTCEDPAAGSVIEVALPDGTTRFELMHIEGDAEAGVGGQHVLVPAGMYTSEVSAALANERAERIAASLLECCFVNKPRLAECDPQPLLSSDGTPMLDPDTGAQIYIDADEETSVNIRNEVPEGTFYSCTSQDDADLQADALMQQELLCSYCNIPVEPGCVPDWVSQAVTTGIVLTRVLKDVPQPDGTVRDYAPGDVYKLSLPLDLDSIIDPYTGNPVSTDGWSVDATAGAAARMYCTADANQSQRLAELTGAQTITTPSETCEYRNVKVIVSCSGGDPFTSCPTCQRNVLKNGMLRYKVENGLPVQLITELEDPSDRVAAAGTVYNKGGIWEYMTWKDGYVPDTNERFVFGMASLGTPWDDTVSFPNCGQYLSVDAGLFTSTSSEEEATMIAMELAVAMMRCVHTNPEVHLYCPLQSEGIDFVAYNYWHPSPYTSLSNECKARAEGTGYVPDELHQDPFVPYYKTLPPVDAPPPVTENCCQPLKNKPVSLSNPCFKSRCYDTTWTYLETEEEAAAADKFIKDGQTDLLPFLDPYWVWGRKPLMPSYAGPPAPYQGVTAADMFAPGTNVMRLSGEVDEKHSWSMRIKSKTPVVVSARMIQQVNYGSQFDAWKTAVEYGIQQLYCDRCAPGVPIGTVTSCCFDPEALNSCIETEERPSSSGGDDDECKDEVTGEEISYLPDCWFYGKTKEEALKKRNCFIKSLNTDDAGGEVVCLYGNYEVLKIIDCENEEEILPDDIVLRLQEKQTIKIVENSVISEISRNSATLEASKMLAEIKGMVCPYINAEIEYKCKCEGLDASGPERYCKVNGTDESITIPEGILVSETEHTYELNEKAEKMAQEMTECLMLNSATTLDCGDPTDAENGYGTCQSISVDEGQFQAPCCEYKSRAEFDKHVKDLLAPLLLCVKWNAGTAISCHNSAECSFVETNVANIVAVNNQTEIPPGVCLQFSDGKKRKNPPTDPNTTAKKLACALAQCVVMNNQLSAQCASTTSAGAVANPIVAPEGIQAYVPTGTIVLPAQLYKKEEAEDRAKTLAKGLVVCMATNYKQDGSTCDTLCINEPNPTSLTLLDEDSYGADGYSEMTVPVFWQTLSQGYVPQSTLWLPLVDNYSINWDQHQEDAGWYSLGNIFDVEQRLHALAIDLANSITICVTNVTSGAVGLGNAPQWNFNGADGELQQTPTYVPGTRMAIVNASQACQKYYITNPPSPQQVE